MAEKRPRFTTGVSLADGSSSSGPGGGNQYEPADIDPDDDDADEDREPMSKKSKMAAPEDDDDEGAVEGTGYQPTIDLSVGGDAAWKRPPLAPINPQTDALSQ